MRQLSPREARLVAILLLVAVVLAVQLAIVGPILDGFAARAAEREALTRRYEANARTIAAIPRLARMAAARGRQTALYTLVAPDAAAATDALRDRMQAAATAVGGEFRGSEDAAVPQGQVGLRVAMRVPADALVPLITRIENTTPLLTITALAVSADEALVTGTKANLDVKLDIAIAFHPAAAR